MSHQGVSSKVLKLTSVLLMSMAITIPGTTKAHYFTGSQDCRDILLAFTRGSGQNVFSESPNNVFTPSFEEAEKESYSFFNWFKTHLDNEYPHVDYKAVSIHDFPGKYDLVGYKAVSVFPEVQNAANGEWSVIPGDYRDSVEHGTNETVGYLKDQIASCPNQLIAVGGYSQGAQVMGEAIDQLTEQERSHIVGVGLFGDPKFIASNDDWLNPFDDPASYPWRRGDATDADRGMLDARIPYIPDDIAHRTVSYCMRTDPICSGWSGFNKDFRKVHSNYAENPMANTVREMMQWAAPSLAQIECAKGGLGTVAGTDTNTPTPDSKSRDIMFLLNDDSSLGSALNTIRYTTDQVVSPIVGQFPNTRFALKGFGEGDSGGVVLPRVNDVQSFLSYTGYNPNNPFFSVSNLQTSINSRYPFGQPYTGGGDYPDPHGLGIERSVIGNSWNQDAEKHLVLITDRPPKSTYLYDICNSTVRSWLQIPNTSGYTACYTNVGTDIWPSVQHPEVCETVLKAIIQTECTNPIRTPGGTQLINRSLEDGIAAAQSQHIAVDVVIPYKVTNSDPAVVPKMTTDLQYVAQATGGKFINYNQKSQFDQSSYSDMLYQIFGHTPKNLDVVYKKATDGQDTFTTSTTLKAAVGHPFIIDASTSNVTYPTYKWDFDNNGTWDETSESPVIQHEFSTPQTSFIRVTGVDSTGTVQAQTHIPVVVSDQQSTDHPQTPIVPDVIAQTGQNGDITLTWISRDAGDLVIFDPGSRLPLGQVPLTDQAYVFTPDHIYATLQVVAVTDTAASDPKTIIVQSAPTPVLVVIDDPLPDDQLPIVVDTPPASPSDQQEPQTEETPTVIQQDLDPTLCYKLQQCTTESDPVDIYGEQVSTASLAAADSSLLPRETKITSIASKSTPQVQGVSTTKVPVTTRMDTQKKEVRSYLQWLLLLVVLLLAYLVYKRKKRVIS